MDLDRDFPDFVRAHQDAVFSITRRLTDHFADAEDAAQDTFVRAYRALQGYDDEQREALVARAWLATIAVNVCRNRARTVARRPQEVGGARAEPPAGDRSPYDAAAASETASALAAALRRIPEVQRRAIVLHHSGGLTYAEVALALGRAEGTVKADVHRGIARLRTILEPLEAFS